MEVHPVYFHGTAVVSVCPQHGISAALRVHFVGYILTPLLAENKKLFREKKQSYIKKIEWLLSCNYSNLSEQTVALLTERNEAIKNYRNKILCAEQLTAHQEEIISSVIHMFCNRLTGDRSLEQKYLNIMREGLSNIIEKGKRNPINEH